MPELSSPAALIVLLLLGLLLLVQTFRLARARSLPARRLEKNKRLGMWGERRAIELLLDSGYEILESQTSGGYTFLVDKTPVPVTVRADFVVRRVTRVFIAEVKAGEESARATIRSTRRQLLEYTYAFDVDGILLVDIASRQIVEVEFPPLGR